jgi:bifunctional DNase/RNase
LKGDPRSSAHTGAVKAEFGWEEDATRGGQNEVATKELRIKGLDRCMKAEGAILVLESAGGNELHVILTHEEAHRIAHELQAREGPPRCPCFRRSIYSLITCVCSHANVRIGSIVLDESAHELLSASVQVRIGAGETSVPCHTADALALAIRFRAPIFASDSLDRLLDRKGGEARQSSLPDDAEAAPWLDRVTPDDFAR